MMKRTITTIIFRASYLLFLLFSYGIGFPTERAEINTVIKMVPNETIYSNGTVVGKYSYMDKEGNPVQVKYYADDSSYGVELNSVKVIDAKEVKNIADSQKDKSYQPDPLDQVEYKAYKNPAKDNKYDTTTSDEIKSTNNRIVPARFKKNPGYEIYRPKDDASNVQCGSNDKAYVYNFEAEPKKIHEPDIAEEESQFCQLLY